MDVFVENYPGEETKREAALSALDEVEVNGVDDLLWRNKNV